MSSPGIQPPNYTQIPNVIFDHWMAIVSPGAFKVLICMCRKIFGWHKTSDTISKNQIMKVTGLSKNSVQTAVEELESHGLVRKYQHKNEYGHQPNTFCLNVEKPKDELYQEPERKGGGQNLGVGRSEFDQGVGQDLTKGVGQNLTPQKKDLTKERLTKDNTPPSPLKGEDVGSSFSPSSAKNQQKKAEPSRTQFREHVSLSEDEHAKLLADYGDIKLNQMLDTLDAYKGSTGKRYKSDYHTLLPAGWVHKRYLEDKDVVKPGVAKHRQGSKLAFETTKDTWKPPEAKAKERTPEEKARIAKEFGVNL